MHDSLMQNPTPCPQQKQPCLLHQLRTQLSWWSAKIATIRMKFRETKNQRRLIEETKRPVLCQNVNRKTKGDSQSKKVHADRL